MTPRQERRGYVSLSVVIQELLAKVVQDRWITATAVVGVYRACSSGDDINVRIISG